jgi:hypothetical protein
MFNQVIKNGIRRFSHSNNSLLLRPREVASERIKELERIIETQSNTIKDFEFEVKKQRGDGYWLGFLSGMIIMFGLRIVDDITVYNRHKRKAIDMKNEIPPL